MHINYNYSSVLFQLCFGCYGRSDALVEFVWVDGDTLGTVVRLVDTYQAVRQLKHVVTQADDDKLGILGPLLDRVEAETVKIVHKHTDRDAKKVGKKLSWIQWIQALSVSNPRFIYMTCSDNKLSS